MAKLGANTEQLNALAESLHRAAATLRNCEHSLHVKLQTTTWTGRDASQFRQRWVSEHRQPLQRAHTDLTLIAARLRDQALEQQAASAIDPADSLGFLNLPNDRTLSSAERFLDGLALSETTIAGGVTVSVLFFRGRFNGQLTFAPQQDGSLAVTYMDRVTGDVGAKAGATAGIAVGGINAPRVSLNGASAGADVGLHLTDSRTWIIDQDDLPGFLVRLAAAEAGGTPIAVVGAAVGIASTVERWFGGRLGIAARADSAVNLPTPVRHDVGFGVNAQAHSSAKIVERLGLSASGNQRMTVGVRTYTEPGGEQSKSLVTHFDGHAVGQLTTRLGQKAGAPLMSLTGGAVSGTIEIPLDGDGNATGLEIFMQERIGDTGGELRERVMHYALSESSVEANNQRVVAAVEQVQRGNIPGAVQELTNLDIRPASISHAEQSVVIDGKQARAGAEVGAGLRIGLTVDGQFSTIDRTGR